MNSWNNLSQLDIIKKNMHKTINSIARAYKDLQKKICYDLELSDGNGKFQSFPWEKEIGKGDTLVLENGQIIEKAAVNFSHVSGKFTPGLEKALQTKAKQYNATGVSSIIHPKNPFIPIIHMNVRFFELDNGDYWFGGGIDLTPHYINTEDASYFHSLLKEVCDLYSDSFYSKFKAWADDYFFLPHRNETRGVGGIFFDRIKPDDYDLRIEQMIQYTLDLGILYPQIYAHLIAKHRKKVYAEDQIAWQNLRRSRYVEFNLLYDRGTKFGLESGGNTESILLSMPPMANWKYNFKCNSGSDEEKTLSLLRKNIDWIHYTN